MDRSIDRHIQLNSDGFCSMKSLSKTMTGTHIKAGKC
jgi:hypothetical protein